LHVLDHAEVELGAVHDRQAFEERDVLALLGHDRQLGPEVDGLAGRVGLVLLGAGGHANAATGAVLDVDLQGVGRVGLVAHGGVLEAGGGLLQQLLVVFIGADDGVRTDKGAGAALDALGLVPDRDVEGDVALLPPRGGRGEGAVDGHLGDRQAVAVTDHDGGDDILDESGRFGGDGRRYLEFRGHGAGGDFVQVGKGVVHRLVVLLDDFVALLAVGLLDGSLDLFDGFILGQDAGNGEKAGLHDRVHARAHARALGDRIAVNVVKLDFFLKDLGLDPLGQLVPNLVLREGAVEEERGAGRGIAQNVGLKEEFVLVAGDEAGLLDQVRAVDRVGAEAQVRRRARAGLFRVVHEVALRVEIGFLADDLDGVLVCAHGAVGAEAEEHRVGDAGMADEEHRINVEAGVGDVVHDANGKAVLGGALLELVEDGLDHGGGEFLGGEAVAAANDLGQGGEVARGDALGEGGEDVLEQRLAIGARLFGPVKYGNGLGRLGQRFKEILGREGPVEPHDDRADLFALLLQFLDRFEGGLRGRSHQHDHALGIGRADVVERTILAAGELAEFLHRGGHDVGAGLVELVDGFAALEIDVRVLGGAADEGLFRIQRAGAVVGDELVADHLADDVIGNHFDLGDFVGGAEAVEEVQERHAGLQRGGLRDERGVHHFLDAVGGKHRPADLAAGHHVLVVAEDREGGGGQRARGDMEDRRGQLARDLVHVGDHQQEALRGGEGGRQRPGLERAVHGAGSAAFRLHFDDGRNGAPEVWAAFGHPLVSPFTHVGRGGDGIDGGDFRCFIGDVGRGLVAVNDGNFLFVTHERTPVESRLTQRARPGKKAMTHTGRQNTTGDDGCNSKSRIRWQ